MLLIQLQQNLSDHTQFQNEHASTIYLFEYIYSRAKGSLKKSFFVVVRSPLVQLFELLKLEDENVVR